MTTKKLYIKYLNDIEFVEQKQSNYSYAFRRLYKMIEESSDKDFITQFKTTFSLNDIEYRSLLADVKSFKKREQEEWESNEKTINDLIDELNNNEKLTKRERFKKMKKIAYLSKGIGRESTFGGRKLLQDLTRECNKTQRNEEKISLLKNEFRNKRVLPFSVMGEANQNGNRFFDISSIIDGKVIYKPYNGKKVLLEVNIPKGWKKSLQRLSELCKSKDIALSVRLSTKHIYLSYDEERLNGYSVDEVSRRKEVSEIKQQHHPKEIESSLIKDAYKTYYDKQREVKLVGKIQNRCIAIDMNPTNIGYSVLDKSIDGRVKIVHCGLIDLDRLCGKSGKASSDQYSKYLNNKRRYEVTMAVKRLFNIANHYRCSSFVIEELSLKNDSKLSREANRKVNNVWNRELFVSCLKRRCNENGIELVEINPCYSSFIGNIQHPYADACNASIEIGRRGLWKYDIGGFYPNITNEDIRTLEAKFGDVVECSTVSNWVDIYKSLKNSFTSEEFSYRLRTRIGEVLIPYKSFSLSSYKSNVKVIIFN